MKSHITIADIAKVVLPRDCYGGGLAMLTAYFDDTGTHADSGIVAIAGVLGTEPEMQTLESLWKEKIINPICGYRGKVSRFHAYDCFHSVNEFREWKRNESEYFMIQLREVIIKSHVSVYGCAVVKKDWDELITGPMRAVLGDAEGFVARNCFVGGLDWARKNCFDPHLSLIFDRRTERKPEYDFVFEAFKQEQKVPPELVGISYFNSHSVLPLQAADLLAWEFFAHMHTVLRNGFETPLPESFEHLARNKVQMHLQIAARDSILKVKEHWSESVGDEKLSAMAKEFTPHLSYCV